MPIRITINGKQVELIPTEMMQTYTSAEEIEAFEVDRNFYTEAETIKWRMMYIRAF